VNNVSRRDVLRGIGLSVGALAAASAALPGGPLHTADAFAATSTPSTSLTPDQAIARLAAGNRRFVRGNVRHPRRDGPRRAAIAEGQAPYAVVLGCADSRVPPEVIYDQGLGDLFVVRIAGNTATDPYVLGSVEYGSAELGAVAIVVLGHESCGAVKAAIDVAQNGTQLPGDIGAFVAPIVPIAAALIPSAPKEELLEAVTLANIRQSVATLQDNALLAESIAADKLKVMGGEYRTRTGKVLTVV
jgi:carbonic anhydrase